jgi:hypothetical protein
MVWHEAFVSNQDPRLRELSNLKLALATFALHLDAFEARVKPLRANMKSAATPQPDINFAKNIMSAMRNPSSTVTPGRR